MTESNGPILVGYDGSASADAAVRWAARMARRMHAPLRVVEAFELVIAIQATPGYSVPLEGLRTARQEDLDKLVTGIRDSNPGLAVEATLVDGSPVPVLIAESGRARAVLLGSRGLGGWTGLVVGSVTVQVAAHAACPVVVIPPDLRPRAAEGSKVVVGVDGPRHRRPRSTSHSGTPT